VLPARGPSPLENLESADPRTEFARPGSGMAMPLAERLGVRALDAARGELELPLTPYVANTLGALQGGVTAIAVDLAATAAASGVGAGPWWVSELALNYLALARVGPVRSRASVLRRDERATLLRVELRDAGAEDRLVAVATARAER
jgi:acyl-coenzyme A thioesterase PaaI-like protein